MKTKTILLPIKPKFVDMIFSGQKTVEYRRNLFNKEVGSPLPPITKIVIYSCAPVSKIVGVADVKAIIVSKHYNNIWKVTKDHGGISEKDFHVYYKDNPTLATAIFIWRIIKFKKPFGLTDLRPELRAPQNFIYLTDQELALSLSLGDVINESQN
jgi:predicted transcriptional regulator